MEGNVSGLVSHTGKFAGTEGFDKAGGRALFRMPPAQQMILPPGTSTNVVYPYPSPHGQSQSIQTTQTLTPHLLRTHV